MDAIENLKQIDPWTIFLGIIAVLVAWSFLQGLWEKTIGKVLSSLKIETKAMRQKREDHEKLDAVMALATKTAENLEKLQERHSKDEEEFRQNLNNYMEESRKDRKALHDEMSKFTSNRVSDRQQSLQIQKELKDAQNEMSNKVMDISNKLDEMQKNTDERFVASEEKENKRVQSEIKERISKIYRDCNSSQKISDIELETLEDLIGTYELHGGKNSFVHSLVQKEMYSWEVIKHK